MPPNEPPTSTPGTPGSLGPGTARALLLVEGVLFPLLFLTFSALIAREFFEPLATPQLGKDNLWDASAVLIGFALRPESAPAGVSIVQIWSLVAYGVLRKGLMFVFNLMCGVMVARRTDLRYVPTRLDEVIVPIFGTFLLLLVPLQQYLPDAVTGAVPLPPGTKLPLTVAAATTALAGLSLSIVGLLYLRRNFSVFVEVKEVVLRGPYRWIRHPLYTGEILAVAGLVLIEPTYFGTLILAALVALQIRRAQMEEARLAEISPEYRELIGKTGMFFPRLGA